jgi:chitinase
MTSSYTVNFAKWDYSMRYPVPEDKDEEPAEEDGAPAKPQVEKSREFKWDMDAKGSLTAHIIPKVTFGIVFDSSAISNAALDLEVDAYTRLYAEAKVGSNEPFQYCYGVDAGAVLFGNVEAPKLFQRDYSRFCPIDRFERAIFEKECYSPTNP